MTPDALLTVAVPKGRILAEAVALLRRAGIDARGALRDQRRLSIDLPGAGLRLLLLRPADVPTYVAHGAADVGVAGSDVLEESDADLYEPLDLGIGRCRMVVAEPIDGASVARDGHGQLRVVTKYPNVTRRWLEGKGIAAEVIRVAGSVEIGAIMGLADRIVDLVQTGGTLRANHLREVETIMDVSSRLVVNRAALKVRRAAVDRLLRRIARVL